MKRTVRPVQYFSDEYLERCRKLSPDDIVRFLDEFRRLYGANCIPPDAASRKIGRAPSNFQDSVPP